MNQQTLRDLPKLSSIVLHQKRSPFEIGLRLTLFSNIQRSRACGTAAVLVAGYAPATGSGCGPCSPCRTRPRRY